MRLTLRPLLAISLLLPFAACPALAASIGSFALNGKNVQLTCATLVPMPGTGHEKTQRLLRCPACKLERIEVNGGEFSAHLVAEPVAGSSGNALAFDMNLRVKMP